MQRPFSKVRSCLINKEINKSRCCVRSNSDLAANQFPRPKTAQNWRFTLRHAAIKVSRNCAASLEYLCFNYRFFNKPSSASVRVSVMGKSLIARFIHAFKRLWAVNRP